MSMPFLLCQVERVRELEISQVRFEEAARYRKELEAERQELEKVHAARIETTEWRPMKGIVY